jgi:hypothetical protein
VTPLHATSRTTRIALALAAAVFAASLGGCVTQPPRPDTQAAAYSAQAAHTRMVEERKDEVIKQLAICESGGYGPSEKPIYGGRGLYLGRLQFATRTVISYVFRRDGVQLNPKQAAALAHDYEQAADLAKYMLFDLEEPWHWPVCARKLGVPQQIAAIKQL